MTSLWSNKEQLYCMPASGATSTAPGAVSVVLSGNTTTNPGFKMPSLRALWGMSEIPGRSVNIKARGTFGTPASAPGTWLIGVGLNTNQATKPTTIVLAATGAFTLAAPNLSLSATNGDWALDADWVLQSAGSAAGAAPVATGFCNGFAQLGPGPAATVGGAVTQMAGGTAVTVDPTVEYWLELYATFSTGPASTVIACNQFIVSAEN